MPDVVAGSGGSAEAVVAVTENHRDALAKKVVQLYLSGSSYVEVSSSTPLPTSGSYAEDSAHVSGNTGLFILGVTNTTGPTSLVSDSGDYTPFQFSGSGELFTTINGMSFGTPADGIANPSSMQRANTFPQVWDGALWQRVKGNSSGVLAVQDNGGSLTVDGTVTATPAAGTVTIPAAGFLAFGSIGAAYASLLVPGGTYVHLTLLNSTNVTVVVSLDAGVTDHYRIPAGGVILIDFASNGKVGANATIQAKHAGVAATRGEISATVIR